MWFASRILLLVQLLFYLAFLVTTAVGQLSSPHLVVENVLCNFSNATQLHFFESNTEYVLADCSRATAIDMENRSTSPAYPILENVIITVSGGPAMPAFSLYAQELRNIVINIHDIHALYADNDVVYPLLYVGAQQRIENVTILFDNVTVYNMNASSMLLVESPGTVSNVTINMSQCLIHSFGLSTLMSVTGVQVGGTSTGTVEQLNVYVRDSSFYMMFFPDPSTRAPPTRQGFWSLESCASATHVFVTFQNVMLDATTQGYARSEVLFEAVSNVLLHNLDLHCDSLRVYSRVAASSTSLGSIMDGVVISLSVTAMNIRVTIANSLIEFVGGRMSGVGLRDTNFSVNVQFIVVNTMWILNATEPTIQMPYGGITMAEPHGATVVDTTSLGSMTNCSLVFINTIARVTVRNASAHLVQSTSGLQNYSAAYARCVYAQGLQSGVNVSIAMNNVSLVAVVREAAECVMNVFGFLIVAVGLVQVDNAALNTFSLTLVHANVDADVVVAAPLLANVAIAAYVSRRIAAIGVAFLQLTSSCFLCRVLIRDSRSTVHRMHIETGSSTLPYSADIIDSQKCQVLLVINTTTFVDATGVAAFVNQCGGVLKSYFPPLTRVYTTENVSLEIINSVLDASVASVSIDGVTTPMTCAVLAAPASLINLNVRTQNVSLVAPATPLGSVSLPIQDQRLTAGEQEGNKKKNSNNNVFGALFLLSSTTLIAVDATFTDTTGFPSIMTVKYASGAIRQSSIRVKNVHLPVGRATAFDGASGYQQGSAAALIDGVVEAVAVSIVLDSCTVEDDNAAAYPFNMNNRRMVSPLSSWLGESQLTLSGCTRWSDQRLTNHNAAQLLASMMSVMHASGSSGNVSLMLRDNACEGTETVAVVPALVHPLPHAAMTAIFVAMTGAAMGSSAGSVLMVEASMGVLRAMRLCEAGQQGWDDTEDSPGTAMADNPLQLSFRGVRGGLQASAGAIVGNTIAMMLWTILLEFVVPCIKRVRSVDSLQVAFHDFLAVLPGDGAAAVLLLLQPTVAASVALLSGPPQAAMILGVLGVMLYVLSMGLVTVWLLRDFPLVPVMRQHPRRGTVLPKFLSRVVSLNAVDTFEKWFVLMFWRSHYWTASRKKTTHTTGERSPLASRVRSSMSVYRGDYPWFLMVDLAVPVLMGVVVGLASLSAGSASCSWIPWCSLAVLLVALLLSLCYRPYATPWLNCNQTLIGNGMSVCVAVLSLVASYSSSGDSSSSNAADLLASVQTYLSVFSVVIDLLLTLLSETQPPPRDLTLSISSGDDSSHTHPHTAVSGKHRKHIRGGDANRTLAASDRTLFAIHTLLMAPRSSERRCTSEDALKELIEVVCSLHSPSQ